jgi:hypothetical protein
MSEQSIMLSTRLEASVWTMLQAFLHRSSFEYFTTPERQMGIGTLFRSFIKEIQSCLYLNNPSQSYFQRSLKVMSVVKLVDDIETKLCMTTETETILSARDLVDIETPLPSLTIPLPTLI